MAVPIMTRSQRRIEKKQALILLALVLGVSLVSFTLGVMIGKSSGGPAIAETPAPERLPVSAASGQEASTGAKPSENLTFYDTLPLGEQPPLGSGINLAPEPAKKAVAATPEKPPAAPSAETARERASAPAASSPTQKAVPSPAAKIPKPAETGSWSLQVASFQDPADARNLQERLGTMGYQASVQEADLGAKGRWYRVVLGPYGEEAARETAEQLKTELKLDTMLRRS